MLALHLRPSARDTLVSATGNAPLAVRRAFSALET